MLKQEVAKNQKKVISNFLQLITTKGNAELLEDIAKRFQTAAVSDIGKKIEVTSAIRLGREEKERIQMIFEKISKRKVPVENKVDPGIIGGLKLRWGDFMLDMTLRARLIQLRQKLA